MFEINWRALITLVVTLVIGCSITYKFASVSTEAALLDKAAAMPLSHAVELLVADQSYLIYNEKAIKTAYDCLQDESKLLRKSLDEAITALADITQSYNTVMDEVETLEEANLKLTDKIAELNKEIAKLKSELNTLKTIEVPGETPKPVSTVEGLILE